MHYEVKQYVGRIRESFPSHFNACRVLDVGSRDVNGNIKDMFFADCDYKGLDLIAGDNVDIISSAVNWSSMNPYPYDTIICTEVLEHDYEWEASIAAMIAMLRNGGLLIITAAGPKRPEHGTTATTPEDSPGTTDYYGNISITDMKRSLKKGLHYCKYEYGRDKQDIYAHGFKEFTP